MPLFYFPKQKTQAGLTDLVFNRIAVVTDYTTNGESLIAVVDTSAPRTITLSAADTDQGKIIDIKDESGGAEINNITIQPASGTIDGAAFIKIIAPYGCFRVYSDGTNWFSV